MSTSGNYPLDNIKRWQRPSEANIRINGYHRPGENNGQCLHFLHGTGFSALTFATLASHLPKDWSLWLTDVPGHGHSQQPRHRMPNWQEMADMVAAALYQQANVQRDGPIVGIGHSMGGVLTLLAAARYPDLFSRIVLLDPVLFKPEIIVAQHLMRVSGAWKHSSLVRSVSKRRAVWSDKEAMFNYLSEKPFYRPWHPQVLTDFVNSATKMNEEQEVQLACDPRWEGSIFGSYPKGLWRSVRKVNAPVDILVATKSYGFIPGAVKKASKINPLIKWQAFGDTHCFPMEQPEETALLLTKLLG